jgi:hypothetical protein
MATAINFLKSELWILSWGASVQRASLFVSNSSEEERKDFRKAIISFAEREILPTYFSAVTEATHEANILHLSKRGSEIGRSILRNGYRIGISQKLLNLYLKYLWCLGTIPEPPHCPVDRVMIDKTRLKGQVAWTQIEDLSVYRQVIAALREAALPSGLSLAKWEFETYDRADA